MIKQLKKYWQERSAREKKIIIIAVVIGLIYAGVTYGFDPMYSEYQSNKRDLKAQKELLDRYRQLQKNADKAREKLLEAQAMKQGINAILLKSTTADLANAELQGLLKDLAQKADLSFSRINPQKEEIKDIYVEISISLPSVSGTIMQLQQFLIELEKAPQFFKIKKLEIQQQRRHRREHNANMLNIEMEISAFIRATEEMLKQNEKNNGNR